MIGAGAVVTRDVRRPRSWPGTRRVSLAMKARATVWRMGSSHRLPALLQRAA